MKQLMDGCFKAKFGDKNGAVVEHLRLPGDCVNAGQHIVALQDSEGGLRIVQVHPDSPFARLLAVGDVILEIDNHHVEDASYLQIYLVPGAWCMVKRPF